VLVLEDFRSLAVTHRGKRQRFRTWARDKGHAATLQATVDALRSGAPEPIPFSEIKAGMQATLAIRAALTTGAPVDVS